MSLVVGDKVRYKGMWLPIGRSCIGDVKEIKDRLVKVDFSFGNDVRSFLIDDSLLVKVEIKEIK